MINMTDSNLKKLRADLHMHPLGHKYFFSVGYGFDKIKLDLNDKQSVIEYDGNPLKAIEK